MYAMDDTNTKHTSNTSTSIHLILIFVVFYKEQAKGDINEE